MKRILLSLLLIASSFMLLPHVFGQNSLNTQTVTAGSKTTNISFGAPGCNYSWTNDNNSIGLPLVGSGSIPPFTAINNTGSPVTATIRATASDTGFAYILGANGIVYVINTKNLTIANSASVPYKMYAEAVSPDGRFVYATDKDDNLVITFDGATYKVVATTPTGATAVPAAIAVSPDGNSIYVANQYAGNTGTPGTVEVIDAATRTIQQVITVGAGPAGVTVSPDGSELYVTNEFDNSLSIINTATYAINTIPMGRAPVGVAISHDGKTLYVTAEDNVLTLVNTATGKIVNTINNAGDAGIAVMPDDKYVYSAAGSVGTVEIDTKLNVIVATIPAQPQETPYGLSITPDGSTLYVVAQEGVVRAYNTATNLGVLAAFVHEGTLGYGNFISGGYGCSSTPVIYTITVNPPPTTTPTITVTPATGTISTCLNTASDSPNLQQFRVTGVNFTDSVIMTAPAGFELTFDRKTYSTRLSMAADVAYNYLTAIWVRAEASSTPGNISGNVYISSTGAQTDTVTVSATINAVPTVNQPNNQQVLNGTVNPETDFTGTADSYSWTNNNPAIGLAASGTGNIPAFTAINTTYSPIIATITVTPLGTTCNGTPVTFTITVTPPPGAITQAAALNPLTTVYGTPSVTESFTVAGSNISNGITISPPSGFEVSADGTTFNSTANVNGTGSIAATPVYLRLAATTHVGSYNGPITLSAGNADSVLVAIPASTVIAAPLTIKPDDKTKPFGAVNPPLTITYTGFVNSDGPEALTIAPNVSTTATTSSPVGQYTITANNASSPDYTFTYLTGVLTIGPSLSSLNIPNTFTPNGDGINDTWAIPYLEYYPKCTVQIFNRWGQKLFSSVGYPVPWDGKYEGATLPTGAYYYIIDPKNGQTALAGSVAIIR